VKTLTVEVIWSSRAVIEVPDDWELPTIENEFERSELDRLYDSLHDAEMRDVRVCSDSSKMRDLTVIFPHE